MSDTVTARPPCRNPDCPGAPARRPGYRRRGYCGVCYYRLALQPVRRGRGARGGDRQAAGPCVPTAERPGTAEKLLELEARAAARLPLHHKDDADAGLDYAGVGRLLRDVLGVRRCHNILAYG